MKAFSFILQASTFSTLFGLRFVGAQPYHVKTESDLPPLSFAAAAGNPLKGFMTSPLWIDPADALTDVPTSLDMYYIPLKTTMTNFNSFDWSHLESLLNGSASRNRHAILRFILDYPSQDTHVPQFLIDGGLQLNSYNSNGGGMSPDYNDANLMLALEQFIAAFGANYDGDSRIGFIQLGLLGKWGQWHTYPEVSFLDDNHPARGSVVAWYQNAFSVTPIQTRYPSDAKLGGANIGLHDDAFAQATWGSKSWHFWFQVQTESYTNFWQTQVMGGRIFPGSQKTCFSSTYGIPISDTAQEVGFCVSATHATYMVLNYAFIPWQGYSGDDLTRARDASNLMGYAFQVTGVGAYWQAGGSIDLSVEVTQQGVAPFYYPLSLKLDCDGASLSVPGVETIISQGDKAYFVFTSIPATSSCLDSVALSLESSHAYQGNPVKLAQSSGVVVLSIPLPPSSNPPSPLPTPDPTLATSPPSPLPTLATSPPTPVPTLATSPPTGSPIDVCLAGEEGAPCTSSTICCSGVGNCSGGPPKSRTCLAAPEPTSVPAPTTVSPPSNPTPCGVNKDSCSINTDCCSLNCNGGQCKGNRRRLQ